MMALTFSQKPHYTFGHNNSHLLLVVEMSHWRAI